MKDRYSRQILLHEIGDRGQKKLLDSSVVIIGCGATGCVVANNLTRAGIGKIRVVDRDLVELNNLQRQSLFDEGDVGTPKVMAAVEKLRRINSDVEIDAILKDVNYSNIESVISHADLVLDGTDNMETRLLINDACVKNGIPWMYGGAIGTYGMTMNIIPGKTPCLRCIIPELPSPGSLPTCDTVGVLNMIPSIIASIESAEALKILIGSEDINKSLLIYDLWTHDFINNEVKRDENCKCCVRHNWEFLLAKEKDIVTSLCGRDAVQITPIGRDEISLEELAEKLERVGEVKQTKFALVFRILEHEIMIFRDGRAIIKGTRMKK